uniref:Aminotransferase class I/classII large domain-containing protein n=1 Tax=Populus trichocarpa TaxID=3694 RepID=A0A3N7F7Z3_POPTR
MGVFGSTVPVITLGSISKRWMVPGWRLGWLVTSDPTGLLQKCGIADSIKSALNPAPFSPTFIQVKLNLSLLEDIEDDMEFCLKLAKEESLVILPGVTVGLKNWLRITFSVEQSSLEDGLGRLRSFCGRHAKKP